MPRTPLKTNRNAQCVRRGPLPLWSVLVAAALIVVAACPACVYYNAVYNAKRAYDDAMKAPKAPDGSHNRPALEGFNKVIEKCEAVLNDHPDSKYADDVTMLMGKAHYERAEYDKAIDSFNRLLSDHPDSKYVEEATLYIARAQLGSDQRAAAIGTLRTALAATSDTKYVPEILFLLGTNLIVANKDDEAVPYLEQLAEKYPGSDYRVGADLEIARHYTESKQYAKSFAVLNKLNKMRLNRRNMVQYLLELSKLHVKMGNYDRALRTLTRLGVLAKGDQMVATQMLLKGQALAGLDSLDTAIDTYKTVSARYPKSRFSAEASYRLGVLYQDKLDSLDLAQQTFDEVPRQFANSEFAEQAVQLRSSIAKLKRLRASLEKGGDEDKAAVKLDVAETQLFQMKDYDKALVTYQDVLAKYPSSAIAPKAAYAIAYIYSEFLKDMDKARVAYQGVLDRYPESQQAEYARAYLQSQDASLKSESVKP